MPSTSWATKSIVSFEDIPAKCPEEDLLLRVDKKRIQLRPGRLDEVLCLCFAGGQCPEIFQSNGHPFCCLSIRKRAECGGHERAFASINTPQPDDDRKGHFSGAQIFASLLEVVLKTAQVEDVVD